MNKTNKLREILAAEGLLKQAERRRAKRAYDNPLDANADDAKREFDQGMNKLLGSLRKIGITGFRKGRAETDTYDDYHGSADWPDGQWTQEVKLDSPRGDIKISVTMTWHALTGEPWMWYFAITRGADWVPMSAWSRELDGEVEEEDDEIPVNEILKILKAVLEYNLRRP